MAGASTLPGRSVIARHSGLVSWDPQGLVATGVGDPGSDIVLAPVYGTGKADYLVVNADGSVNVWQNAGLN